MATRRPASGELGVIALLRSSDTAQPKLEVQLGEGSLRWKPYVRSRDRGWADWATSMSRRSPNLPFDGSTQRCPGGSVKMQTRSTALIGGKSQP